MANYVLADIRGDAKRIWDMLETIECSPADVPDVLGGAIDCGCGHNVPGAARACLRLDDMREFHV